MDVNSTITGGITGQPISMQVLTPPIPALPDQRLRHQVTFQDRPLPFNAIIGEHSKSVIPEIVRQHFQEKRIIIDDKNF
jgi:hypothetical protein